MNPSPSVSRPPGAALPPGALRALLRRPDLWPVAVRQGLRLAPTGWWRRRPHLPVPSPDYLHFRYVTAYGGEGTPGEEESGRDLVAYLEWCRAWPGSP